MTDPKLAVWHNGDMWVVASSAEDAGEAWLDYTGDDRVYLEDMTWTRCEDSEVLAIEQDPDGDEVIERTFGEWAALKGHGYLCREV